MNGGKMKEYTYQWKADKYDDETLPILKVTKSSFGSYQWCPLRYQFQYEQRLSIDQTDAMRKGTIVHVGYEDFYNKFDINKAEGLSNAELQDYCMSLYPIDDYTDIYKTLAINSALRFKDTDSKDLTTQFLPVVNEVLFDAEITIPKNIHTKFTLKQDYKVHLQGIIDRMFLENNAYIPMEFKTGLWKDWKQTMMRKEMAFYQLLLENCPNELLEQHGVDPHIKITHWGWYYPESNFTYIEEVKKSSRLAVLKGIATMLHAYELNQFDPKFYARTCIHCSFYGICDAAQNDGWI
jgi:CRISPR/Cas system-associated exonuclease Cas4 (RecB family)